MSVKPILKPGDWITIGSGAFPKQAVVSTVYDDSNPADIEVVYLDERERAINEDMVWKENKWEFLVTGPSGGYADNYPRLNSFVAQLRRGEKFN